MSAWQVALVAAGVALAAVNAGAFFAFSNFVMPALGRLDRPEGIRAMQQINLLAPNPLFVAAIMGAGPIGIPVAIASWDQLGETGHTSLLAAIVLSIGSTLVTITLNVPRNNALDAVESDSAAGATLWNDYLVTWTRANTARSLASIASVVLYALAFR
ncbi:MAG: DUF1772 domain-containing protein [Acidimicrobiales bacterium]|nr:DUF1772 domain-containing protein [Acidimicrobiales bacterium]